MVEVEKSLDGLLKPLKFVKTFEKRKTEIMCNELPK